MSGRAEIRERLGRLGFPDEEAAALLDATLTTLAERVGRGTGATLAAALPADIDLARVGEDGERFDDDELVRRVAARAGQDTGSARAAAHAVIAGLARRATNGGTAVLLSQIASSLLDVGLVDGEEPLARLLDERPPWHRTGRPGEWAAEAGDGLRRGVVRVVAGDYEGTVQRWPTGPTPGDVPEISNGPQVFADATEVVRYVEANLGL